MAKSINSTGLGRNSSRARKINHPDSGARTKADVQPKAPPARATKPAPLPGGDLQRPKAMRPRSGHPTPAQNNAKYGYARTWSDKLRREGIDPYAANREKNQDKLARRNAILNNPDELKVAIEKEKTQHNRIYGPKLTSQKEANRQELLGMYSRGAEMAQGTAAQMAPALNQTQQQMLQLQRGPQMPAQPPMAGAAGPAGPAGLPGAAQPMPMTGQDQQQAGGQVDPQQFAAYLQSQGIDPRMYGPQELMQMQQQMAQTRGQYGQLQGQMAQYNDPRVAAVNQMQAQGQTVGQYQNAQAVQQANAMAAQLQQQNQMQGLQRQADYQQQSLQGAEQFLRRGTPDYLTQPIPQDQQTRDRDEQIVQQREAARARESELEAELSQLQTDRKERERREALTPEQRLAEDELSAKERHSKRTTDADLEKHKTASGDTIAKEAGLTGRQESSQDAAAEESDKVREFTDKQGNKVREFTDKQGRLTREWQSGENEKTREFTDKQGNKVREFTRTEREGTQEWKSSENKRNRKHADRMQRRASKQRINEKKTVDATSAHLDKGQTTRHDRPPGTDTSKGPGTAERMQRRELASKEKTDRLKKEAAEVAAGRSPHKADTDKGDYTRAIKSFKDNGFRQYFKKKDMQGMESHEAVSSYMRSLSQAKRDELKGWARRLDDDPKVAMKKLISVALRAAGVDDPDAVGGGNDLARQVKELGVK